MSVGRSSVRPRRLGLLTSVRPAPGRLETASYPYAVGDRIAGDLTVTGHLATGRLGHLYQVWSATGWCALTCKILAPGLRDDRRAAAALRREARILARVRHPNLIRSFGGGEHDGLPYLLMEYVDGPSLFDVLEQRPGRRLSVMDAIRVGIHIGAGLLHLHGQGYLHLDLKPANLLLRGSIPVLADFDAARRLRPLRRPRESLGTAPYMAPEQVRCAPLTPAADVYGIGAVLYELVTGRWPFESVYAGEERRAGEERLHPQLGAAPPPRPRRFNPDIPPALERTILRCLAPDPRSRFPSLHPLLLELAAALDGSVALWPQGVRLERRRSLRGGWVEEAQVRASLR